MDLSSKNFYLKEDNWLSLSISENAALNMDPLGGQRLGAFLIKNRKINSRMEQGSRTPGIWNGRIGFVQLPIAQVMKT